MPVQQPISEKIYPTIGTNKEAADPLYQRGHYLEFNKDDGKATRPFRLSQDLASYKIALARPKETKKELVKLSTDPGRHVDKRSHIPNMVKRQGICNQGLPRKRERSGTPGLKTASDGI